MSSPTTLPAVAAAPPPPPPETLPPVRYDFFAGLLSYMLPGMGQVSQGRVSKGVVFFVSLHALFFYGMYLGSWENVWLPKKERKGSAVTNIFWDVLDRPHFAGQVCIGMAAWPGVYQYLFYEEPPRVIRMRNFQRAPSAEEINRLQRDSNKTWDLGWVYTVIAGVLNLLVIYDAVAGPAFRELPKPAPKKPEEPTKS